MSEAVPSHGDREAAGAGRYGAGGSLQVGTVE
jgi:hypothetical protein